MTKSIKFYMAVILAVTFLGSSLGVSSTLACSSLAPGKHLGLVMMVDPVKGNFTLIDAETREAIRFVASAELLRLIQKDDTIIMSYEKENGRLVAKEIVVQPVKMSSL
jgi:hypothetical protein